MSGRTTDKILYTNSGQYARSVVQTLCDACSPPKRPRYEGKTLILEAVVCACECSETVFAARGPRCEKCNHPVKIKLTDGWEEPNVWIDPKTHRPVHLNQVKSA